jgi:hypothetical protein
LNKIPYGFSEISNKCDLNFAPIFSVKQEPINMSLSPYSMGYLEGLASNVNLNFI